ncbi:MAG TPA: glycosyl transferase [Flexistipes sinusarabici]|uniref:Glycosyl transferase n=1 Tax=Flexistipes sinusarabici TaxID=2352 RepID=A0A3D5QCV9_FLESI|nr:glycosyl transferase [Flexistipes sinusarabici]
MADILFIHQNFPGQFKHLAPALASDPVHNVVALNITGMKSSEWRNIKVIRYPVTKASSEDIHPWVLDFESKVIRGDACRKKAEELKKDGFYPDIVIAHPGWGESLFLKEIWPETKLGIYCEFFYHVKGADVGFDPEFPGGTIEDACRLKIKNTNNILHMETADFAISPTKWQASTFPQRFRDKISVIHDGIDTEHIKPNSDASAVLNNKVKITKKDNIITFVSRNLEPCRGYHIFMRSLPEILKNSPDAKILIVGGANKGYGQQPPAGKTWKEIFFEEIKYKISGSDLKRIYFLGNLNYKNFINLLQLSTVHVYLTYPFVLSWSLLEAMSAGCSIVASDTEPLREVIKNEYNGVLVDFFDIRALAGKVCELLDNSEKRIKLGRNARNFVKENYDLNTVCLPAQLEWVKNNIG